MKNYIIFFFLQKSFNEYLQTLLDVKMLVHISIQAISLPQIQIQ